MSYHLLTGATGLLGRYLLRDCSLKDVLLAVVVRPTKRQTARQRIEAIMVRWEEELGRSLPRPVVLEGDLTEPRMGLSANDLDWVASHCSAVIHNAASLTFVKTKDGEPFRSNVDGTRNVLAVCRETGVRRFHHVSTAYICGLRSGRVLESELDVGQQSGNDYEASKITSERMVVESEFLDQPVTVFRPGIIIGDSQNGFTSTFHGFYSPLRIAHALCERIPPDESLNADYARSLLQLFGLQGEERKNFVPVDWVSKVMANVIASPEHHGQVYHLTPSNLITISDMVDVMFEAIAEHVVEKAPNPNGRALSTDFFEEFFHDQLSVYQSYWRDDPEFDRTNTLRVQPSPCPEITREMLQMMCRFAVKSRFGAPLPLIPGAPNAVDLQQQIQSRVGSSATGDDRGEGFIGLQINGESGGQWELEVRQGVLEGVRPGLSSRCSATLYLNSRTFQQLSSRRKDVWETLYNGSVLVQGNGMSLEQIAKILDSLT